MGYRLVEAGRGHVASVIEMCRLFHRESAQVFEFSPLVMADFLLGLIGSYDGFLMVAINDDGKPIGFVCGSFGRNPIVGVNIGEESIVYVLPEERGRAAGLGSKLLDEFDAWAIKKGANFIRYTVQYSQDFEATVRLFRRRGARLQEGSLMKGV